MNLRRSPPLNTAPAAAHETLTLLRSRHTGRVYRVQVFMPTVPAPPEGYPVFYLTDGSMGFRQAADQMMARALTDLRAAVIVGVAYPSDDIFDFVRLRTWDLTPDRPRGAFREVFAEWGKFGGYGEDDTGGAERFYHFLLDELRPWLASIAQLDAGDQTLCGHSLGGLFGLHVLFNHGTAFHTYALSSPTLVWNDGAVLQAEAAFAIAVERREIAPRILLMRGGGEDIPQLGALAHRLQSLRGGPRYQVEKAVFSGEHHMSVTPAAISRALSFAYSRIDPLPDIED
jgi:predicted alpha/beta superfamily hydrolase